MAWKVLIERGNLGFSAAHFITFADSCEPLHGHNYGVRVEVGGRLNAEGYVLDFVVLKSIVRAICKEWDHRFLLPLRNPHLRVTERQDVWDIEYDAQNRYSLARLAVVPLDVDNATAERLAEQLTLRILDQLRERSAAETLDYIMVGVEETEMQTAFYTLHLTNGAPGSS